MDIPVAEVQASSAAQEVAARIRPLKTPGPLTNAMARGTGVHLSPGPSAAAAAAATAVRRHSAAAMTLFAVGLPHVHFRLQRINKRINLAPSACGA